MYEGMFLVDSAAATSNWDEVEAELQRVFERADAEVLNLQKWDDRRLCYDIAGHKRGTYILTYFNVEPGRVSGIERDVKLNEKLLLLLVSIRSSSSMSTSASSPMMGSSSGMLLEAEATALGEKG